MTAFEFSGKGIYTMITESDIENYPGMALRSLGAGRFKAELWDTDKFFIKGGKTPWRIVTVCRSLEELVHCRIITHAAAPASDKIYENADWIRPGKSAWSFFIDEEHSRRFEKIMEFNALAQEAGYEYNLADSGWRDWARTERGAFKKVKELVDDAEKHSVGIWLWQSAMDKVWFAPYRRRFFKKCQALGIKGIKLDHIESETQFMTEFYRRFAREAAEYNLMVIYHNPQKPTAAPHIPECDEHGGDTRTPMQGGRGQRYNPSFYKDARRQRGLYAAVLLRAEMLKRGQHMPHARIGCDI